MGSHCGSDCVSLVIRGVEHLFMDLWTSVCPLGRNVRSGPRPFLFWIAGFVMGLNGSSCVFDVRTRFANFPRFFGTSFSCLAVPFPAYSTSSEKQRAGSRGHCTPTT